MHNICLSIFGYIRVSTDTLVEQQRCITEYDARVYRTKTKWTLMGIQEQRHIFI